MLIKSLGIVLHFSFQLLPAGLWSQQPWLVHDVHFICLFMLSSTLYHFLARLVWCILNINELIFPTDNNKEEEVFGPSLCA